MALATLYLGRLLFQWPVGSLSDRLDRRIVLAALSIGITLAMMGAVAIGEGEGRAAVGAAGLAKQALGFALFLLLGGMIFPLYSVASAFAFDRAQGRSMIDVSKTLLVFNAIGAFAGPVTVMLVSAAIGDPALHACIIIASLVTAVVSMVTRAKIVAPEQQTPALMLEPQSSMNMMQAAAELVAERLEDDRENRDKTS